MPNKRIIDYNIIGDKNTIEVKRQVLEAINSGWELQGGVAIVFNREPSEVIYAQAIVKYEDTNRFVTNKGSNRIT